MKKVRFLLPLLAVMLLCVGAVLSQGLSTGSKLFIEPMNGFENYLTAAIQAKKVPVTIVLDKSQADYIVTGSWRESNGGTTGNGSILAPLKQRINNSASVSIVDPKTTAVVFAYSANRSETHDASKQLAEDWATQLLKQMSGKKKP
jgi:hypothetical protein